MARIEELTTQIQEARDQRRRAAENADALTASSTYSVFKSLASKGWPSKPLGTIAEVRSGVTLGRKISGPTVRLPYLQVANVQDGHLDLSVIKEVEDFEGESERWKLKDGDLLLTEGGDWDKLGRGTIWQGEIPNCIHQNHIFRVRLQASAILPKFLALQIGSPIGKEYFRGASKQTTNLASINQSQLKAFNAILPPIAVQNRIVNQLETLQSEVAALKLFQKRTEAELDALLPTILDRAFKEEL